MLTTPPIADSTTAVVTLGNRIEVYVQPSMSGKQETSDGPQPASDAIASSSESQRTRAATVGHAEVPSGAALHHDVGPVANVQHMQGPSRNANSVASEHRPQNVRRNPVPGPLLHSTAAVANSKVLTGGSTGTPELAKALTSIREASRTIQLLTPSDSIAVARHVDAVHLLESAFRTLSGDGHLHQMPSEGHMPPLGASISYAEPTRTGQNPATGSPAAGDASAAQTRGQPNTAVTDRAPSNAPPLRHASTAESFVPLRPPPMSPPGGAGPSYGSPTTRGAASWAEARKMMLAQRTSSSSPPAAELPNPTKRRKLDEPSAAAAAATPATTIPNSARMHQFAPLYGVQQMPSGCAQRGSPAAVSPTAARQQAAEADNRTHQMLRARYNSRQGHQLTFRMLQHQRTKSFRSANGWKPFSSGESAEAPSAGVRSQGPYHSGQSTASGATMQASMSGVPRSPAIGAQPRAPGADAQKHGSQQPHPPVAQQSLGTLPAGARSAQPSMPLRGVPASAASDRGHTSATPQGKQLALLLLQQQHNALRRFQGPPSSAPFPGSSINSADKEKLLHLAKCLASGLRPGSTAPPSHRVPNGLLDASSPLQNPSSQQPQQQSRGAGKRTADTGPQWPNAHIPASSGMTMRPPVPIFASRPCITTDSAARQDMATDPALVRPLVTGHPHGHELQPMPQGPRPGVAPRPPRVYIPPPAAAKARETPLVKAPSGDHEAPQPPSAPSCEMPAGPVVDPSQIQPFLRVLKVSSSTCPANCEHSPESCN